MAIYEISSNHANPMEAGETTANKANRRGQLALLAVVSSTFMGFPTNCISVIHFYTKNETFVPSVCIAEQTVIAVLQNRQLGYGIRSIDINNKSRM